MPVTFRRQASAHGGAGQRIRLPTPAIPYSAPRWRAGDGMDLQRLSGAGLGFRRPTPQRSTGDVGHGAGGVLGYLPSIIMRTISLVIMAGFVVECCRYSCRVGFTGAVSIFRMAPIHHYAESVRAARAQCARDSLDAGDWPGDAERYVNLWQIARVKKKKSSLSGLGRPAWSRGLRARRTRVMDPSSRPGHG